MGVTFFYILIAIAILLVMIIIHEFGHYIVGKLLKFKINEFSVGFGPKLLQRKNKDGELITLRLIPLGGYCAFEGEDGGDGMNKIESSDKKIDDAEQLAESNSDKDAAIVEDNNKIVAFNDQPAWKRFLVLIAGATFNLVSAVIFSFILILCVGYAQPVVTYVSVDETGTAYHEFMEGDRIIGIDGRYFDVMTSYSDLLKGNKNAEFIILRDGKEIILKCTATDIIEQNIDGNIQEAYFGYGATTYDVHYVNGKVGDALKFCVPYTVKLSLLILRSLWQLITGEIDLSNATGTIGTVVVMAQVAKQNWRNIFVLIPLIAANLGLFNLLPIPALDGSKALLCIVEMIRRKPLNRKVEAWIHAVGFIVLIAFVLFLDAWSLLSKWLGK